MAAYRQYIGLSKPPSPESGSRIPDMTNCYDRGLLDFHFNGFQMDLTRLAATTWDEFASEAMQPRQTC